MRSQAKSPAELPAAESKASGLRSARRRFGFAFLILFVVIGVSAIAYLMLFYLPKMNRQLAARMIAPQIRSAEVGESVYFGAYEQDNDPSNGPESIEWIVVDKREDSCLLMSRYGLNNIPLNDAKAFVTWETCSLRTWLNNTFYHDAFNTTERTMILLSEQETDVNPYFKETDPGNNTQEKVFIPNIIQVVNILEEESVRLCEPTAYAIARGVVPDDETGCCCWWLRSPGFDTSVFTRVLPDGGIGYSGNHVQSKQEAVRPFVWVTYDPTDPQ